MTNVKEFSVEEKLSSLVTLQKIESKLDEIHILKGELPMEVADLEDEITGLKARQTRIEEEINGVTDFIAQRNEAIKEAQALIKKYDKQSSNVKNNREFEAINKEMEMQQLEVKLAEKHIKDATEEIAEKAVILEKAKKNLATKESVLNTKKRSLQQMKKKKSILISWRLKQNHMLIIACWPVMKKSVKVTATAWL
jgi:predicted  nucleic acid-binding Zn-ribbon protein